MANRVVLREELQTAFARASAETWLERLREVGVPCAPVRDVADVFADADVRERSVRTVEHPVLGEVVQVLSPFRFNGDAAEIQAAPPALGEHTHDVLGRLAHGAPVDDA